jgi:hypothetical protein
MTVTPTKDKELATRLEAAVAGHSIWKKRLYDSLKGTGERLDPASLEKDNLCELGKWLYANPQPATHAHYHKVRDLHAAFHKEAAAVLRKGLAGKQQQALKDLDPGSQYARLSGSLVMELSAWKRSL